MAGAQVRQVVQEHRFELWLADQRAGLTAYQLHGDEVWFVHTEIDDRFAGQGLASQLIGEALDAVRAQGRTMLPYCPFVRAFVQKHPQYRDLVPAEQWARFDLADPTDQNH